MYCRCQLGPTPCDATIQLLLAWFAWLCKWLLLLVYGGGLFTVNLVCSAPHPSSTDSLWRGCRATWQTPPVSSSAMLHCSHCHPLGTCVRICSPWQLVVPRLSVHATVQLGLLSLGMQTPRGAVMVDAT